MTSILELLEPVTNPSDIEEWGLTNPGGILLFGPPGCGKTFWATQIAQLIGYNFLELPRSMFGSNFVDGAMLNLKIKLDEIKQNPKTLLFFDEFDSIANARSNGNSSANENSKVVNTLLQEIPKLIEKNIIIIGATNFIEFLDPAVIRPGRFDLKIPVFPPNRIERTDLIIFHLTKKLSKDSKLFKILKFNNALVPSFWIKYSNLFCLYSNSLIIDFTQSLKKKLKSRFNKDQTCEIIINDDFIVKVANETSSKLTRTDMECYAQFYNEVKNLGGDIYNERLDLLLEELHSYFYKDKEPPRPIGFRNPIIE